MFARSKRWMIATALVAAGCTNATAPEPDRASETETVAQPLGEATQAYWFEGNGAELMPSYQERVAWHLVNQVRMNTDVFDVRDMDDNLIPPAPPLIQQTGMTETGRWQGRQALEYTCYCTFDQMSMSFVEGPAGSNPYTCCNAGYVNGTIRCTGPVVACGDDGMMEPEERWGLLNKGPGEIRSEVYWSPPNDPNAEFGVAAADWFLGNALGFALNSRDSAGAASRTSVPLVPPECQPPESGCEGGKCVGPNGEEACDPADPDAPNECIGVCEGGSQSGDFCTIPEPLDPETCDPENLPRGYYWSFLFGQTSEPTPFLNDVIHATLEGGAITVLTNYFDPIGPPQTLEIVTSSSCNEMERSFERPGEGMGGGADVGPDAGDAGGDEPGTGLPYAGNTYQWEAGNVSDGCVRYMARAVDAEGFEHTYPTFGSLGMKIVGGAIAANDDACPIWVPEVRPDPACLPDADECTEGATRLCYTGRPGTEDKGICETGTETCAHGRWEGLCDGEVIPERTETCGDSADNNCNGFVDEDCPIVVDPNDDEDMGGGNNDTPDAGGEPVDMGGGNNGGNNGGGNNGDGDEDDKGCCATVDGRSNSGAVPTLLAVMLLGFAALRRRFSA